MNRCLLPILLILLAFSPPTSAQNDVDAILSTALSTACNCAPQSLTFSLTPQTPCPTSYPSTFSDLACTIDGPSTTTIPATVSSVTILELQYGDLSVLQRVELPIPYSQTVEFHSVGGTGGSVNSGTGARTGVVIPGGLQVEVRGLTDLGEPVVLDFVVRYTGDCGESTWSVGDSVGWMTVIQASDPPSGCFPDGYDEDDLFDDIESAPQSGGAGELLSPLLKTATVVATKKIISNRVVSPAEDDSDARQRAKILDLLGNRDEGVEESDGDVNGDVNVGMSSIQYLLRPTESPTIVPPLFNKRDRRKPDLVEEPEEAEEAVEEEEVTEGEDGEVAEEEEEEELRRGSNRRQVTESPTLTPTQVPTVTQTEEPTSVPTAAFPTVGPTGIETEEPTINPTVGPTGIETEEPTINPTVTISPTTLNELPAIFINDLETERPLNNAETRWSADLKFRLRNPDDDRIEGAVVTIEYDNGFQGEMSTVEILKPSNEFGTALVTLGRFGFELGLINLRVLDIVAEGYVYDADLNTNKGTQCPLFSDACP
eukprot:CAMPEP_0194368690 /NCGR_PEP_ID=MMETSP0174-20130528/16886_1 /TAXON_ID=216777 /ORGANISM="Proboscia alata, Strain PI-D3" /LENGTH=541 /DNA_ID=CAMNT_0039145151 /DNA_START=275 /DNA_END=1897 /DNA_ORIENTATION=+